MINQETTVGEFLDEWLESAVKGTVRYSTFISYSGYIKNHVKRVIGGLSMVNIRPTDVQGLVGKLCDEKHLSARTIGIIIGVVKNAFSYAEDCEIIDRNPCRRIRLPKVEEEDVKVFDNFEQTRIEKAVFGSTDNRCYGIVLALYTGLRIGEICALRWDNIDFNNKCIYVRKSLNRVARSDESGYKTIMAECEPKTKKSKRVVHLPDFLTRLLRKLKNESASPYVFSMKNGKYVHPRTMQILYKKILAVANVCYSKFHVLRHTFATRAAEMNADPKTVSEILGHSTTQITLNRYTHSLKEQKQKVMNELNQYFKSKKIVVTS